MSTRLLQVNFDLDVTPAEYERAVSPLAEAFAAIPGLRWKIWLLNPGAREAGGLYLFEDQRAAGDFLDGPLAGQLRGGPAVRDVQIRLFEVMTRATAVTRGPVGPSLAGSASRPGPGDA